MKHAHFFQAARAPEDPRDVDKPTPNRRSPRATGGRGQPHLVSEEGEGWGPEGRLGTTETEFSLIMEPPSCPPAQTFLGERTCGLPSGSEAGPRLLPCPPSGRSQQC